MTTIMWLLEDGAECWDPRLPLQKLIEYGQGSFIKKYLFKKVVYIVIIYIVIIYIVIIKESLFRT